MTQSYTSSYFKVNKAQLDYVDNLTSKLDKGHKALFIHILISTLVTKFKAEEDFLVPVSADFMKEHFGRTTSWLQLHDAGLILDPTNYSKVQGISRKYKLEPTILETFLNLYDLSIDNISETKYNLVTGKRSRSTVTSTFKDATGNLYPELIRSALHSITRCFIKLEEAINFVALREYKAKEAKLQYEAGNLTYKEYFSLYCRYLNDKNCLMAVMNREPELFNEETRVWVYTPAYTVQMSGRISQYQGALQTASKELKHISYTNIHNLVNYDLQSSQVNGLIQQFQIAGIDASWLINYRDNPKAKYDYAAEVGVTVETWKNILCALIMGAHLSKFNKSTIAKVEKEEGLKAILGYLSDELLDTDAIVSALVKLNEVVKPLKKSLDLWHDYLVKIYVPRVAKQAGKCKYIHNATGIKLNITELFENNKMWRVKAVLAAYILQGQESAFIHNLTVISSKYGFEVIANEMDGVVSMGFIPEEAMAEAAKLSGLENAKLVIKAFTDIKEGSALATYLEEGKDYKQAIADMEAIRYNIN